MKGRSKRQGHINSGQKAQNKAASLLDQLQEFEHFQNEVLPALREDLANGMTAEQIRQKYHSYIVAAQTATALVSSDPKTRLAAAKDILDRNEGKPKETVEQTHKLQNLSEEEIDSLLASEFKDVKEKSEKTEDGGDQDELPN